MFAPEYANYWWSDALVRCTYADYETRIGYLQISVNDCDTRQIEGIVRQLRKEFECDVDWGFAESTVCLYSMVHPIRSLDACARAFRDFIPSPVVLRLTKI